MCVGGEGSKIKLQKPVGYGKSLLPLTHDGPFRPTLELHHSPCRYGPDHLVSRFQQEIRGQNWWGRGGAGRGGARVAGEQPSEGDALRAARENVRHERGRVPRRGCFPPGDPGLREPRSLPCYCL